MHGHEIDRLGRGQFSGNAKIAFVLAVLVIDQNEHTAGFGLGDNIFDGGQRAHKNIAGFGLGHGCFLVHPRASNMRATYRANISISKFI